MIFNNSYEMMEYIKQASEISNINTGDILVALSGAIEKLGNIEKMSKSKKNWEYVIFGVVMGIASERFLGDKNCTCKNCTKIRKAEESANLHYGSEKVH